MIELIELSATKHSSLKVSQSAKVDFAKSQQIMRIRVNEIPQAVTNFPVVFSRNGRNGAWVLSILTGLAKVQNTFVREQQWTAIFQPSCMQTYPFYLMQTAQDNQDFTIGIDETSNAFDDKNGQAVFDEKGSLSLYFSRVKAQLEASIQQDFLTQDFVKNLEALDLLKAIDLHIRFTSGAGQKLAGLYVVDEAKLKHLSAEQLAELNHKNYLVPIHAMLVSLHQVNALIRNNNSLDPDNQIAQLKMEVAKDDSGF